MPGADSWLGGWSLKDFKRRRQHKKERVKFGYSTQDWWSFDSYLAGVIASGLERFASEEAHGHPADLSWEEWQNYLNSISVVLRRWENDFWGLPVNEGLELEKDLKEAMHKFADRFTSLWD